MREGYVKSLADLIAEEFKVATTYRINPVNVEVGIAVTAILPTNPKRLAFLIMNLSANNIFIAPDMQVTAARGIFLTPAGGNFSMEWRTDFEAVTLPWYGTAGANNSGIFSLEVQIAS